MIDNSKEKEEKINEGDPLWLKDKKDGKGTYTSKSGDIYVGLWVNDKRSGSGIQTYANGSEYIGQWENDYINGSKSKAINKLVLKLCKELKEESQYLVDAFDIPKYMTERALKFK